MKLKTLGIFFTLTLVAILGSVFFPRQKIATPSVVSELDQEITFYEKRIDDPSPSFQDLTILAQFLVLKAKESGNEDFYVRAELLALRSLKEMPFYNTSATYVLADIAQAHHEFKKATELAKSILKEKPNSAEAYSVLTTSFLAMGELREALSASDKLIILTPSATSSALKAIILSQMGKFSEADKNFKQALAEIEDDKKEAVWTQTVYARYLTERREFPNAEIFLKKSLHLLPSDAFSLHQLGDLWENQNRFPEAIDALNPRSPLRGKSSLFFLRRGC